MGTAPPGYAPRPNQNQSAVGLPAPSSNSKYSTERLDQPQPWIDDVDMGSNWYSPFEPVWPFGPPYVNRPREWDFPTGYNLNYIPQRMQLMAMLRGMARTWGVLATIISTRQDQLLRIPWTIQSIEKPGKKSVAVDEMRKFFKCPDGKLKYSQWSRKLTDDLLILDAPTIYFSRDRRGRPIHAEVLDGATIFPIIDDAGRRPDSIVELDEDGIQYLKRQPAFQQIIKGFPMIDLDESELMYLPMRPRPDLPIFGYPPTEQIMIEVSEAVRKTFYQLDFWAEGNIPDLIVTVPDTWSPRQIAMFQAHMDAQLGGNPKLKSKMRFVPGGMKPFDIKNSSGDSLWSQRDETLIRLACYAYSVTPAPFIKMLNRSTAQSAQQMAEEEGLYPLMSFWKDDIMDSIIQERFGYEDVEFVFLPKPEPDAEKQTKVHDMKLKNGEITINEARDEIGLEPIPNGDQHLIYIGNAIIPLKDATQGKALPGAGAAMPGAGPPTGGVKPGAAGAGARAGQTTAKPQGQPQAGSASPRSSGSPVDKLSRNELDSAADSADGDLHEHSAQQLHAGNYPKGHVWIQGLNISIENSAGSARGKKTTDDEVDWEVELPTHYGYIRGTVGADDDQIDCFVGPEPNSDRVFIIDQNRVGHKSGKVKGFDEHKAMIGYASLSDALKDYLKAHGDGRGPKRLGPVVELSMAEFKLWLKSGETQDPISEFFPKRVVHKTALAKADTISSSTGLSSYSQLGAKRRKRKKSRKAKPTRGPRWLTLSSHL
jgi:hypothetical protein